MSKTLLFLRDHKIESLEQLNQLAAQKIAERDELLASVQQSERRLAEIGTLNVNANIKVSHLAGFRS